MSTSLSLCLKVSVLSLSSIWDHKIVILSCCVALMGYLVLDANHRYHWFSIDFSARHEVCDLTEVMWLFYGCLRDSSEVFNGIVLKFGKPSWLRSGYLIFQWIWFAWFHIWVKWFLMMRFCLLSRLIIPCLCDVEF